MTNSFPNTDFSKSLEISMKLVDLNVTKFTTIVEAQTAATTGFVELVATRVKAAAEIKDYDSLLGFAQDQTKIMQSNVEKLIADCKSSAEDTIAYGKEVQQILDQSTKPVKASAKKAA